MVVLAAGAGERYGGTKQLAPVSGRPLVAHAVAAAVAAGAVRTVVVVGHDAERVAAAARAAGTVEVVVNPDHQRGQASSLVAGIRALAPHRDVEVVVILLADQPGVTPAAVAAVAGALGRVRGPGGGRPDAARARYGDGPGHPVAFRRSAWARLLTLTGDAGARHLLEDLDVAHVRVPGRVPADVDTPADLRRVAEAGGGPDETAAAPTEATGDVGSDALGGGGSAGGGGGSGGKGGRGGGGTGADGK